MGGSDRRKASEIVAISGKYLHSQNHQCHRALLFSFFFLAVGDPTFNRFYKKRCGFFSVVSAKRELILFLVMYVFIRQPENGKALIESIMPDTREMPLYKMINDPLRTVMGVENVNRNAKPVLAKAGNGRFWASAVCLSAAIALYATQRCRPRSLENSTFLLDNINSCGVLYNISLSNRSDPRLHKRLRRGGKRNG